MRRALLAALAALGVAGAAWAGQYSGITSMTFQNGVAPTAAYAGIADARIEALVDADINFGANKWLIVSGASATPQSNVVMSADLSALPDSAIILRARLWLYQMSRVSSANSPSLTLWRVYRPFTVGTGDSTASAAGAAGVTWNYRKSAIAWNGPGATGHEGQTIGSTWGAAALLAATDTTVGTTVFVGQDTLDTGAATTSDTPNKQIIARYPKGGTAAGDQYYKQTGWISFDITNAVRSVNSGAWAVNGFQFVITGDEEGLGRTGLMIYPSSDFTTGGNKGGKVYRPKIIVEFFDPATSSGTSGRRNMGAGMGGAH